MIYVIQAGNINAFKVGFCQKDPYKRVKELQTGSSFKLKLLATIDGSMTEEKALHVEMRRAKLRGEWFRWNKVLEQHVEKPLIDDVSDTLDLRLARANSDNKWLLDECERKVLTIQALREELADLRAQRRELQEQLEGALA